jgi:hypothetical protein
MRRSVLAGEVAYPTSSCARSHLLRERNNVRRFYCHHYCEERGWEDTTGISWRKLPPPFPQRAGIVHEGCLPLKSLPRGAYRSSYHRG